MASVVDLKSKEEKDAELDRKIEALRKKNEALVKRHKLIEEDRKRAEQEGNAVTTPRKVKIPDDEPDKARKEKENFSITLDVSAGEKRIVSDSKSPRGSHTPTRTETSPKSPTQRTSGRTGSHTGGRSPHFDRPGDPFKIDGDTTHPAERPARGRRSQGAEGPRSSPRVAKEDPPVDQWGAIPRGGRSRGRGGGTPGRGGSHNGGGHSGNAEGTDRKVKEWEEKRKQNIEKMNEEMEKIAEYERNQRDGVREKNPIRNFLDDPRRTGPIAEVDRKEGSRRHNRNWGGPDFEKVKTGMDREKESHVRRPGVKNQVDMTMSMTGRERAEYVRWKQEREQIDQERLARHRKPTGQWRREWDAEKTDSMFKDGSAPHIEDEPMGKRDSGKKGAPKPPTMAEFLPKSLQSPGQKRDQKRGRGRNKPYSMHDSRWEEDEEEEVNEKDKTLPLEEKEKETCVEKTEEKKVEGPQKICEAQKPTMDEKRDEFKHEKEEEECEEEEDEEEEDDEEWTDASGDEVDEDGSEVEEDSIEEATKASPASPKEQRLPKQMDTPKLTMPPPNATTDEEEAVESKPTSPFSPEGHRPVTDWGEEMELLSPPGSSNEDSPPQTGNRKVFSMDSRSHSDSTQNPSLDQEGVVASSIESSSLQSPEVQADQKQKPVKESPGGEPLVGALTLPLERDPDSSTNQGKSSLGK
ncbi:unnamed protein product [Staurois parvus]|uniref:Coiled-coil domain-containing protein 9 n=1 Tax=Staurois parvus TaxID=386267 RepID=A0ABN9AGE4_9NEOB|nr:unnamed protein product [Staurois parvus]